MTFQASSLRKYGLSLAFLLLIVLAAVLSIFALSSQNTPAHADGISVDNDFFLIVDLSKSGNGQVYLDSNYIPYADIQVSVDDQVVATFQGHTTAGYITVQPGEHTIVGRYAASDGTVTQSAPTVIRVSPAGEITSTNHSYQSSVSQPDSSAMNSSSIDVQPTDVSTIDQ